jgi:hypothetical protein
MANDVLNDKDLAFIKANATAIKQMANGSFAGNISIEQREQYERITLKLGRRFNVCWTCGGSLSRIGKQLEEYVWH